MQANHWDDEPRFDEIHLSGMGIALSLDMPNLTKMLLGFHPIYTDGLHEDVRFPRQRYRQVEAELKNRGGERIIDFFSPEPAMLELLKSVHDADYIDRFIEGMLNKMEQRRIGLRPWTADIIPRTLILTGGTVAAAEFAFQTTGYGANMAGGTHHAYRDHGSGYCIVNDIAIAAAHLLKNHGLNRIAVIDLDVHQGDGTAAIFKEEPRVYTISVHGDKNFPFRKQRSDYDIALSNEIGDTGYLEAVSKAVNKAAEFKPEFIIFQGGVDPLETDRLGKLSVSREGLIERNKRVYDFADSENIPCLVLMGGGYSDPIQPTVMALADLFIEAAYRHQWRQNKSDL